MYNKTSGNLALIDLNFLYISINITLSYKFRGSF